MRNAMTWTMRPSPVSRSTMRRLSPTRRSSSRGLKISSTTSSQLIFDTPAQKIGASMFMPGLVANSTGTALNVVAANQPMNVNGVTRTRLTVQLLDAVNGTGFGLNTTNIGAGEYIQIVFFGLLST